MGELERIQRVRNGDSVSEQQQIAFAFYKVAYRTASENCDRAFYNRARHRNSVTLTKLHKELSRRLHGRRDAGLGDTIAAHMQVAASAIVFSAATLESFINNYVFRRLHKRPRADLFRQYESNVVGKWREGVKAVTRKDLSQGSQELLTDVFRLRNAVLHYRTSEVSAIDFLVEIVKGAYAVQALKTFVGVELIIRDLATHDRREDVTWIDDRQGYLNEQLLDAHGGRTELYRQSNVGFLRGKPVGKSIRGTTTRGMS